LALLSENEGEEYSGEMMIVNSSWGLLGCNTMCYCNRLLMFQRILLPLYSEWSEWHWKRGHKSIRRCTVQQPIGSGKGL